MEDIQALDRAFTVFGGRREDVCQGPSVWRGIGEVRELPEPPKPTGPNLFLRQP